MTDMNLTEVTIRFNQTCTFKLNSKTRMCINQTWGFRTFVFDIFSFPPWYHEFQPITSSFQPNGLPMSSHWLLYAAKDMESWNPDAAEGLRLPILWEKTD